MEKLPSSSNARELEISQAASNEGGTTYAKEHVGVKPEECGRMGMRSNEDADTLAVSFSQESAALTKKGTLNKVAEVYDALGRASPTILERKFLYRSTS